MSEIKDTKPKNRSRKILMWIFLILLVVVIIYFFTYYLANRHGKVIYQDTTRRIYLIKRGPYGKPNREMWRMVYEDMKTGERRFITGNSPKGYSNAKMAQIVLNTIDQGKASSFDSVQGAGVTIVKAKTDIHSNLIDKKGLSDYFPEVKDFDANSIIPA